MEITFWQLLLLMIVFGAFILGSFALGMFGVYKTKRDKSIWAGVPTGEAFHVDDMSEGMNPFETVGSTQSDVLDMRPPDIVGHMSDRIRQELHAAVDKPAREASDA